MSKLIYFAEQQKINTPITKELLQPIIDSRIAYNIGYDDLLDESIVGDYFLFCGIKSINGISFPRIRQSKIEEKLEGYTFDKMSGILPVFIKYNN